MECECPQVWDVFEVEERDEGEARFALYATVELPVGTVAGAIRDVSLGERCYEGDRCPSCDWPLEEVVEEAGYDIV